MERILDYVVMCILEIVVLFGWPFWAINWAAFPTDHSTRHVPAFRLLTELGIASLGAMAAGLGTMASLPLALVGLVTYFLGYIGCRYTLACVDAENPYPW